MSLSVSESRSRSQLRMSTALQCFRRDEDGSFVIFSLFIFTLMILIGGIAIDVMRFENLRTTMQNTVDRAVLAAADLDQKVPAETVVADYLNKAGMEGLPYSVDVVESKVGDTVIGRKVSVSSEVEMKTYFMHMMGTPTLSVPASTSASEAINDIEVSLVLDVSGSMGWGSKLSEMQDAASDFVDEIMLNTEEGRVAVSLVPYSTQVNAGEVLASEFNLTDEHTYSHCVDFTTADFNTPAFSPTVEVQRTAHFDPWRSYKRGEPRDWVCRTEDHFEILPWSAKPQDIKDQIDDFVASGNTSIDVATKWGAALLDPSTAPVLSNLIASGDVEASLAGRPSAYSNPDVLKFMVIMTDGINTTQYGMTPEYSSGPSGIWRDPDTGRYTMEDREIGNEDGDSNPNEPYWYAGGWRKSYGEYWLDRIYDRDEDGDWAEDDDKNAYEMDWTEVFARMSVNDWAYSMHYERYSRAHHYHEARDATRKNVNAATKDKRLNDICTAAKNSGIVIFAIGFEVTDHSAGVMQKCASTANHFYRVEGLDIAYAFESIANQINQLKLTQ
ncbi:MAG: pilus assembly protein TadG-related protein [Paracoccaceae bacterium]|nr:pilus assembly protein TadG-related protein [Paracoccaceae bacterium]